VSNHQEWNFYELMWRIHGRGRRLPLPWWIQQYFRAWQDDYDHGLFGSREAPSPQTLITVTGQWWE
jgi:hypothetical protein